ncbi:glycosyltransferase [Tenacibaculum amylolyticum]|uniref:glycosyltransferase n=1 Tax=Tenacibaculum amylolyticum TaxID=104269 RepID=UPI00389508B1
MNILVIYRRNIDINDSGASRTTIQLLNYLVNKNDVYCYTNFKIVCRGVDKIKYVDNIGINIGKINRFIIDNDIDIIFVPEGYLLSKIAHKARLGTKCKLVGAMHNKPGYEKRRVWVGILESLFFNESRFKRFRAFCAIVLYPIAYLYITQKTIQGIRKGYKYSDKFVLLSKHYVASFKKVYRIDNDDKLEVIENALSFNKSISYDDVDKKEKKVLVVSRFSEMQKRLSIVFKVWSEIQDEFPDWTLNVVGFGRSFPFYKMLAKKYKMKNFFIKDEKRDTYEFYKKASIFLMTSDYEGWPMTLNETLQLGCVPIVMNSFDSLKDIIDNGKNGIVVDKNNIHTFKKKMSYLMKSKDKRKEMSMNGIESSKRFKREIICEKYYKLFKSLI